MDTIDLLKEFNNLKISKICEEQGIIYTNLISGKSTKDNEEKVKRILTAKIYNLWMKLQFGVDENG